jgi:prefoldin subunit 5
MEEKIRGFASLEERIEELETELRDLNAQKDEIESFLEN